MIGVQIGGAVVRFDVGLEELMSQLVAIKTSAPTNIIPFVAAVRRESGEILAWFREQPATFAGQRREAVTIGSRLFCSVMGRPNVRHIPEGSTPHGSVHRRVQQCFANLPQLGSYELVMADDVNEPAVQGGALLVARWLREDYLFEATRPTESISKPYYADGKLEWGDNELGDKARPDAIVTQGLHLGDASKGPQLLRLGRTIR